MLTIMRQGITRETSSPALCTLTSYYTVWEVSLLFDLTTALQHARVKRDQCGRKPEKGSYAYSEQKLNCHETYKETILHDSGNIILYTKTQSLRKLSA